MKKILVLLILPLALLAVGCNKESSTETDTLLPVSSTSSDNTQDNTNCDIKGNISSSGEKIYHVPGGQYYGVTQIDRSKGEKMFCSEDEAEQSGWRKSKR